ncbi:MAG: hypothetical protein KGM47_10025, partial [Acidobacteriota bacterium]|nr:hypothetical protein [Acidobacteriota bacterium]
VDLETGRIQKLQDDWAGAAATYDDAVRRFARGEQNRASVPRALILLRAAQAHEHNGDLAGALDLYHEASEVREKSAAVYQAELAAARLDQHFNHSERARQEYMRVAESAPDPVLGDAAREALRRMQ